MMDFSYLQQAYLAERKSQCFLGCGALADCTFASDNGKVAQISHAANYIRNWKKMRQENIGLLFWGPPGCGKTFCAACIANALLEQREFPPSVMMANLGTILRSLLAKSPQEKEEFMNHMLSCDLLILDDLGMERQTEYAREQIFSIIDGRCMQKRPLVITTNLTMHQMKQTDSLAEKRIFDRVLELCVPVRFSGESLRQQIAAEKLSRYQAILDQDSSLEEMSPV